MMGDIAPIVLSPFLRYEKEYLEVLFGIVAVVIYSWTTFNTWTGKEENIRRGSIPKHYTTLMRFLYFRFQYIICYLLMFSVFLAAPDFMAWMVNSFPLGNEIKINPSQTGSIPLWSAFMIIVVVPSIPGIKKLDQGLRTKLHQRALIPIEAKVMSNKLKQKIGSFQPTDDKIEEFLNSDKIPENLLCKADFKENYGSLRRLLAKLLYLDFRLDQWKKDTAVLSFFQYRKKAEQEFHDRVKAIVRASQTHFESVKTFDQLNTEAFTEEDIQRRENDVRKHEEDLIERIDKRLDRAYEFISCGILATEIYRKDIKRRLAWFGFNIDLTPHLPRYSSPLVQTHFAVFLITFFIVYFAAIFAVSKPDQLNFSLLNLGKINPESQAVIYGFIVTILYGIAVITAYGIYVFTAVRHRSTTLNFLFSGIVKRSITHYAITGILSLLIGMCWIPIVDYILNDNITIYDSFLNNWIWGFIPAFTSLFITYYCCTADSSVSRIKFGFYQGGSTGVLISLIAGGKLLLGSPSGWSLTDISLIIPTITLTSASIGILFAKEYRKNWKTWKGHAGVSKRKEERVNIQADTKLTFVNDEAIHKCSIENISISGAKVDLDINQSPGTYVKMRIPNFATIEGKVYKSLDDGLIIRYSLSNMLKEKLKNYLDEYGVPYGGNTT